MLLLAPFGRSAAITIIIIIIIINDKIVQLCVC